MVSAAPKLVAKTAKAATDLMASASLVAILDGRGHSVKREVITYSDKQFSAQNLYCFCIPTYANYFYNCNDFKVWSLLKQCEDKLFTCINTMLCYSLF